MMAPRVRNRLEFVGLVKESQARVRDLGDARLARERLNLETHSKNDDTA